MEGKIIERKNEIEGRRKEEIDERREEERKKHDALKIE